MKYIVIGLGIYGSNLAADLTRQGHEVIGADIRRANVEAVKDIISTVYVVDSTEESSLSVLPFANVDLVIVAIGENFGASIKTVALLRKNGVRHIYARAIDSLHEAILRSFQVDRILLPEQRAAKDLAAEMDLAADVTTLGVDGTHTVMSLTAPAYFIGMEYGTIELEKHYGLRLIAVTRPVSRRSILGMAEIVPQVIEIASDTMVSSGDRWVVYGARNDFHTFIRHVADGNSRL